MPLRKVKARVDQFRVRAYRDPIELQTRMNLVAEAGEAVTGLLALNGFPGKSSEVWLITKGYKLVEKEIDIPDVIEPTPTEETQFRFAAKGED